MEAPLFCLMVSLARGWVLKVSANPGRKERRREGKSWASDTGTSHAGARERGGERGHWSEARRATPEHSCVGCRARHLQAEEGLQGC